MDELLNKDQIAAAAAAAAAAAEAARATGNDLFREQKYSEVRPRASGYVYQSERS